MRTTLAFPGEIDDRRNAAALPQQRRTRCPPSLRLRVNLDEIGRGLLGVPDEDSDREHRLGHRKNLPRATRALGEDEAGEIGTGGCCCLDVFRSRQSADLHKRPCDQLRQLRCWIDCLHKRRPDEDAVRPRELGLGRLRPVGDPALGDDDAVAGCLGNELELARTVDCKRGEVASVDPDRVGIECDRSLELALVVCFDEGIEPTCRGLSHELGSRSVVEVAKDEEDRVGPSLGGNMDVRLGAEESLREEWEGGSSPGSTEIVPASAETLAVNEDRHCRRAGALVGACDRRRVRGGPEVACRG